jgi:hypothetical protein
VLDENAYDVSDLRDRTSGMNAAVAIPSKCTRKVVIRPDAGIHQYRNQIEQYVSRLKHFRRFAPLRSTHRSFHRLRPSRCGQDWLR